MGLKIFRKTSLRTHTHCMADYEGVRILWQIRIDLGGVMGMSICKHQAFGADGGNSSNKANCFNEAFWRGL